MLTARPADLQLFFDAFMVVAFRPEVMDSSVSVVGCWGQSLGISGRVHGFSGCIKANISGIFGKGL